MFGAALRALHAREERGKVMAVASAGAAHTQQLDAASFIVHRKLPQVEDCGLFGTTCDGNSFLQAAIPSAPTPKSAHLSP
mmetsp:Transcript_24698/g.62575  ORF Transcript_24698/g.62575 Transcript_24698/m.62575 type:complete len:80 (+) Transcript_24698:74-313(+)